MSAEVGLTEAEREALSTVLPVSEWDYDPDRFKVEVEAVVAHIVTDRVADAIAQERADRDEWARIAEERLQAEVAAKRALAEERAAWVAKIEALANEPGSGFPYVQVADLRALLSSDATAACACVCHSGGVGTGCRQSRCEVCPPATAALNTVQEQAKAEERVHDHPPYRPVCNERLVDGQLRGACLNDDGSEAGR